MNLMRDFNISDIEGVKKGLMLVIVVPTSTVIECIVAGTRNLREVCMMSR